PFGTRREIKNLNSFKFMQQAIDYEVQWQIDLLEDGGTVRQATVLFDPASGETRAMRSKEDAHDYRYFPDPDLPPLVIPTEWVERVRTAMPELPQAMAERLVRDYALPPYDAATLTQDQATARYFEAAADAAVAADTATAAATAGKSGDAAHVAKLVANWMMGELARRLNAEGIGIDAAPLPASTLARLVARIADGTLSNSAARQVFDALWSDAGTDVDALIDAKGLKQLSDSGALESVVDAVIAANAKSVGEYRAGKEKAFNALVGQAMKATQGKANPEQVAALLKQKLA
ncbi:MAG: Asp-tRNA(Asn)/Glu-tRNA(Gln) amidotransferase GatCAB subunit B, partial [Caldimonas sp.]